MAEVSPLDPALVDAAGHLRWLLERGYPRQASVKLVGDRHRLDKGARQILYRGVMAPSDSRRRQALLAEVDDVRGSFLGVDGHNVVLTLANYLSGVPVFHSDDGVIRDIGALHGRLHDEEVMLRCLELTAGALADLGPGTVLVFFDAPLSHSRDHARYLRDRLRERYDSERCRVETAASGDEALKAAAPELAATSDSAIIDALGVPVFDLARYILEREFDAEFPDMGFGRS